MQKRPPNFDGMGEEPGATLVTPRFAAEEGRHAHPVVPPVETDAGTPSVEKRTRASYSNAHVRPRRGPRRSWPTATLVILMLAAAAAGGVVATKVFRPQAAAPAQTEFAPAQAEA